MRYRSGMADLRDQFEYFYAPGDKATATALRTGLVTADTNVLLSLYRFQRQGREELFGALELIGDRLWIPHQVAYEFHQKRLSVISGQESYFSKTKDELDSGISSYLAKLAAFSNRIALPQPEAQQLEDMIREDHKKVLAHVSNFEAINEVHLENRDSDEVLIRLEKLFSNRVGEPMNPADLEAARKEAERRVKAKVPPGYMDRDKPDPSGDYIIFKQLMHEAGMRKLPTVFITDDRKEDWYRREHGLTLGARYELRKEMAAEAGVPFLIMTSDRFLVHAKNYLAASVSLATVDQAKELQDSQEREHRIWKVEQYRDVLAQLIKEREKATARLTVILTDNRSARRRYDELAKSANPEISDNHQALAAAMEELKQSDYETMRAQSEVERLSMTIQTGEVELAKELAKLTKPT